MIVENSGEMLLTYKEYSERTGISEATVRQLVHRGNLWIVKVGKKPYIYADDMPMHKKMGRPRVVSKP